MKEIFEQFDEMLALRFEQGVFTTEDSIRYTFFAALLNNNLKTTEVILEYPHPVIERARVDTWLPKFNTGGDVAIEFKYDRSLNSNNQPRPKKAGAVFKDLRRQALIAKQCKSQAYFIYITSQEMSKYYFNEKNGFLKFWNLNLGETLELKKDFFDGKSTTFLDSLGGVFDANICSVYTSNLPNENFLRVYEVE
jgi:hypothetical protein